MTDVLTGRVQLWIAPVSVVIQQVEGRQAQGHRRDHGAARRHRSRFSNLGRIRPARHDLGLWFGLLAPPARRSRSSIGSRISPTARSKTPDFIEPLRKTGTDIVGGSPEEFARYIDAEVKKATAVAVAANIRQ